MSRASIWIGTAGWGLRREWQHHFPGDGQHLERYARVLPATEVNTTFRKLPMHSTLERWRGSVPPGFRFAVKAPRAVTHDRCLVAVEELLDELVAAVAHLEDRLGPLLFQLPPFLAFDRPCAEAFFRALRERFAGAVALEPRHPTWFEPAVEALLRENRVARVAADPPRAEPDGRPGGHTGFAYFRLHGSPTIYYSAYRGSGLEGWERRIRAAAEMAREVWCVFDNTAEGEATADALALQEMLVLD